MIKKFTNAFSPVSTWMGAMLLSLALFQSANAQQSISLNYIASACSDPYVQAQGQTGTTLLGSGCRLPARRHQ